MGFTFRGVAGRHESRFGNDIGRDTMSQSQAMQYLVGNPLFAIEMTQHAIGAGLYAPLRVLIYEAEDGRACVEYDLPSSLFGQFGDERVDRVAVMLDRKLAELVATAAR
jgi:uncharacterized protein (DUF302 family)